MQDKVIMYVILKQRTGEINLWLEMEELKFNLLGKKKKKKEFMCRET